MKDFCSCEEWQNLKSNHKDLFKWLPEYGWVITWIELSDEKTHTQKHTYGLGIKFCPMCGEKLEIDVEVDP